MMKNLSGLLKRLLAMVLAFFVTLVPMQATGDVLLTLPTITTATETFEVTLTNKSDDTIAYGLDAFSIEQRTFMGWSTLKKSGDYVVVAILLSLAPGDEGTLHVNLPLVYGKALGVGVYRFCFEYFSNYKKAVSSVTFTVGAA